MPSIEKLTAAFAELPRPVMNESATAAAYAKWWAKYGKLVEATELVVTDARHDREMIEGTPAEFEELKGLVDRARAHAAGFNEAIDACIAADIELGVDRQDGRKIGRIEAAIIKRIEL